MLLTPDDRTITKADIDQREDRRATGLGEALGSTLVGEFMDWNTLSVGVGEINLADAEWDEYGDDLMPSMNLDPSKGPITFGVPLKPGQKKKRVYLTEEEFKASEHFREGMEWMPRITPLRAKVMAENFDKRREREKFVSRLPDTALNKTLLFGASLLANIPDPVNFIPFLGQASKAKMLGRFGSVGGRMLAGSADAAIGNALTTPALYMNLKNQGEDLTLADYGVDVLMGGIVGALFGGGHGVWRKFRGETKASVLQSMQKAALDVSEGRAADVGNILKGVVGDDGVLDRGMLRSTLMDGGLDDAGADAFMRELDDVAGRWAEGTGRKPEQWVGHHIAEIHTRANSVPAEAVRFHAAAMRQSTFKTLNEFALDVMDPASDFRVTKMFHREPDLPDSARKVIDRGVGLDVGQGRINIPSDTILHVGRNHPDITPQDWGRFSTILEAVDEAKKGNPRKGDYGGIPIKLAKFDGEQSYGIVLEFTASKRRGEVLTVRTFFKDEEKVVRHWLQKKEGVLGAEDLTASDPAKLAPSQGVPSGKDITTNTGKGKTRAALGPRATGMAPDAVKAALAPLQRLARRAAPVRVWETQADLPEHVLREWHAKGDDGYIRGAYDGSEMHVVAENVRDAEDVVRLWRHEQGLHRGIRGLFGETHGARSREALDGFLDQVFDRYGADGFDEIKAAYELDFGSVEHRRVAAEERLAAVAEKLDLKKDLTEVEQNLWREFVDWLRNAARKMGAPLKLSDDEIVGMVKDSMRWTIGGGARGIDPAALKIAKRIIYDKGAKARITIDETGTPFPRDLSDRPALKQYFDTLEPEQIQRLRLDDPDQYVTVLKDIADHLFPDGVKIAKEAGGESGVEHLLKTQRRRDYIHSLANTLEHENIRVELTKDDGVKALYLKRYFDDQAQKDLWDIVVLFNNEVHTKFQGLSGKGKREWTRTLELEKSVAKAEASQLADPGGNTESASTHQGHDKNITTDNGDGKTRFSLDRDSGAVEFRDDGRAVVHLFDGADPRRAAQGLARVLGENPRPLRLTDLSPERAVPEPWDEPDPVGREGADDEAQFFEMQDVEMLRQEGRLTPEDEVELRDAGRATQRAEKYRNAYEAAVACLKRGG